MDKDEIIHMAREAGFFEFNVEGWIKEFERFAALVAEPWIETNKALAKEIIELHKQAEQEPVGYFAYDEEHDIWEELTGPNAPGATPLYTHPVRTKDLTDDEIMKINVDTASIVPTCDRQFHFARAVIAADREKNRGD